MHKFDEKYIREFKTGTIMKELLEDTLTSAQVNELFSAFVRIKIKYFT